MLQLTFNHLTTHWPTAQRENEQTILISPGQQEDAGREHPVALYPLHRDSLNEMWQMPHDLRVTFYFSGLNINSALSSVRTGPENLAIYRT
jgi:hypothetical protein